MREDGIVLNHSSSPRSQSPKPPQRFHPLLTTSRPRPLLRRLSPRSPTRPRSPQRTARRRRPPPRRRKQRRALRRKSECHKRAAACACFATMNAAIFHSDSTFICLYDPYLCWIKSRLLLSWFWRYYFFTPPSLPSYSVSCHSRIPEGRCKTGVAAFAVLEESVGGS